MSDVVGWLIAGGVGLAIGGAVSTLFSRANSRKQIVRVRRAERRARSAERLAELGSMTSGLAHEIKNPLSTIGLNIQLLAESLAELKIEQDDRVRLGRRVDALQREIERLKDILTDFLDFAGEKKLDPSSTDLNAMVGELADFFHPQAERQSVRLYVTPSTDSVVATVDGPLVKQAVLNLLLNALQAMGEPGESSGPREIYLRTEIADDAEQREARLRVADTGEGMDDETLASIFTPYFTTKSSGTGLGLPTSRRIIEEHGGRIEVHSEPGRGTEFTLVFPIEEGAGAA
ncbi:MAG: two-component sensor histidine kinase [Phycisphaera sp.]|nr:MAG: two-component sensor histidine kinase [Phycisphaera sp.]